MSSKILRMTSFFVRCHLEKCQMLMKKTTHSFLFTLQKKSPISFLIAELNSDKLKVQLE